MKKNRRQAYQKSTEDKCMRDAVKTGRFSLVGDKHKKKINLGFFSRDLEPHEVVVFIV